MMLEAIKNGSFIAGGLLLALALAGCGNLSKVSDKGTTDEPVWPKAQDVTFATGSYPDLDDLRLVRPGMTKDQLYNLLGRPHFAEGLAGVREWDYLFHFRTPQGDMTCQYKVLFDKDKLAQSFFWKPEPCADVLKARQPAKPRTYTLGADVLFAFGSATLTSAGLAEVDRLAADLHDQGNVSVGIVGHTDRIGGEAANQQLSQRRAEAVAARLAARGVPAGRISASGAGESQPVAQCQQTQRQALIDCLAPNRRVEISVRGAR